MQSTSTMLLHCPLKSFSPSTWNELSKEELFPNPGLDVSYWSEGENALDDKDEFGDDESL